MRKQITTIVKPIAAPTYVVGAIYLPATKNVPPYRSRPCFWSLSRQRMRGARLRLRSPGSPRSMCGVGTPQSLPVSEQQGLETCVLHTGVVCPGGCMDSPARPAGEKRLWVGWLALGAGSSRRPIGPWSMTGNSARGSASSQSPTDSVDGGPGNSWAYAGEQMPRSPRRTTTNRIELSL